MELLYLDKHGKVRLTHQGGEVKELKELYSTDRSSGKKFFNNTITYMYWVYGNSIYKNMELKKRKEIVLNNHVERNKYSDLESFEKVRLCIEKYRQLTFTTTERLYLNLLEGLDEYIVELNKIPYKKHGIRKETINGDVKEIEVELSNMDEKSKAYKSIIDMLEYKEQLDKIMKKDKNKISRGNRERKLFEDVNDTIIKKMNKLPI